MLNLNVGGVVFHAGQKRTIEAVKDVVGQTFLKLNGHAYLVRLEHVKPVVRLTEVVRAEILVGTTVGKSPFKVTRQDFEEANIILMAHNFGAIPDGRALTGLINEYLRRYGDA